jgi:hypothetical protein
VVFSAFGEVWKGVVHGTEVAVKKLLIKDIKNERGIIQDFLREVQMMTYAHSTYHTLRKREDTHRVRRA